MDNDSSRTSAQIKKLLFCEYSVIYTLKRNQSLTADCNLRKAPGEARHDLLFEFTAGERLTMCLAVMYVTHEHIVHMKVDCAEHV